MSTILGNVSRLVDIESLVLLVHHGRSITIAVPLAWAPCLPLATASGFSRPTH